MFFVHLLRPLHVLGGLDDRLLRYLLYLPKLSEEVLAVGEPHLDELLGVADVKVDAAELPAHARSRHR